MPMHTLTLQLADDIYDPLVRQAHEVGRTPEAMVSELVAAAVNPSSQDPLLQLLGSLESDATDVAVRHDEYIGRGLAGEVGA